MKGKSILAKLRKMVPKALRKGHSRRRHKR
jgi:hypothetical protein